MRKKRAIAASKRDRMMDDKVKEFNSTNPIKDIEKTDNVARIESENAPFGVIFRCENSIDSLYFCPRPLNGDRGSVFSDMLHNLSYRESFLASCSSLRNFSYSLEITGIN